MKFRLGVDSVLRDPQGAPLIDVGLEELDHDLIDWEFLPSEEQELPTVCLSAYDGVMLWSQGVRSEAIRHSPELQIIARMGVGLDSVDVDACTDMGILVTVTPDGVRIPVASAAMTLMLALGHDLRSQLALAQEPFWPPAPQRVPLGLAGRTLGLVGLGNIGRAVADMASAWRMQILAHDPYLPASSGHAGADLVELDELLERADYVCLLCPLTKETKHLIDDQALSKMKPTAYLVNVARGAIVDTDALLAALDNDQIAGAGLDVFEVEPLPQKHPLLSNDKVVATPHALACTQDFCRSVGLSAVQAVTAVATGGKPAFVANPLALQNNRWAQTESK